MKHNFTFREYTLHIVKSSNHNPNLTIRQDTDVSRHLKRFPNHVINFDDAEILGHSNHWHKLLITETLLIQKHLPDLNVDKASTPLYLFNT